PRIALDAEDPRDVSSLRRPARRRRSGAAGDLPRARHRPAARGPGHGAVGRPLLTACSPRVTIGHHVATGDRMKLCQFHLPDKGLRVGVVDGDQVVDVTSARAGVSSVRALVETSASADALERRLTPLVKTARSRIPWARLDRTPSPRAAHL